MVSTGWVSAQNFLAGYGAAQTVPGAILTTIAIFLPAFLLVIGILPFWSNIREHSWFHGVLLAVNAAVVGILLAALYNPIWVSAIKTPGDICLALIAFGALRFWNLPPWLVVIISAVGGMIL